MTTDLSHIKVGDKLATRFTHREYGYNPAPVAYTIWEAVRLTDTLIICSKPGGAGLRVRRTDGKVIGTDYTVALEATPELLDLHRTQLINQDRYTSARRALSDLIGMQYHELKLSVRQLEHLAKAWAEVKAMR